MFTGGTGFRPMAKLAPKGKGRQRLHPAVCSLALSFLSHTDFNQIWVSPQSKASRPCHPLLRLAEFGENHQDRFASSLGDGRSQLLLPDVNWLWRAKKWYHNCTLVSETKDQNPRSPSSTILSHSQLSSFSSERLFLFR